MLVSQQQKLQDEIQTLAGRHGRSRAALIPILQELQETHASVSDFAMQVVADELGIHPAEVYGVVSFYAFLHHEPRGRFQIRLCQTISCDLAGKARVARQLENELGIRFGETTPDGRFSLEWASCLGMCDQGPALLVNDRVYTRVSPERVHRLCGVGAEHLAAVFDNLVHLIGRHAGVDAIVDEQRRALVAHAQAAGPLEAEAAVRRGLAEGDAQLVLELARYAGLAGEIARNRLAQPHLEPAPRFVVQEGVERDDPVDLGGVNAEFVGYDLHGKVGDRRVLALEYLQDRHQRGAGLPVLGDEGLDL
ncbi:MAG TPA: NAD(P)H-dependent oxidoreductase subunit E, partial [Vicinamibacterales bacterium]|nr:NAD(P)H-dependent oxidoreductase subunit E [Vicinamibacterales bacterium]